MITERDKNILKLINRFGFLGMAEIKKAWEIINKESLGERKIYQRMKKMKEIKLVSHQRIVYGSPGVYYLTRKGVEIAESELSAPHGVNLISYVHRLEVARVLIKLLEKYPGSSIKTERELFKIVYKTSGKILGEASKIKIPDGILLHDNGTKDAVEVELSKKTNTRLCQQIKQYKEELYCTKYNRVLYFCSKDSIIDSLKYIIQELGINDKILVLRFNKQNLF